MFQDGNGDIIRGDGLEHQKLLDHLVGSAIGDVKGLLPQILSRKGKAKVSTLVDCIPAPTSCSITVKFDVHKGAGGRKSLSKNFGDAVRLGRSAGHDVSTALYELHSFLTSRERKITIPDGENKIIIETNSR
jgi:hypothetical protein